MLYPMKNLLISFLITGFLCGTSAHASSQGTSTSMLLRFENSTTCAAGETATTSATWAIRRRAATSVHNERMSLRIQGGNCCRSQAHRQTLIEFPWRNPWVRVQPSTASCGEGCFVGTRGTPTEELQTTPMNSPARINAADKPHDL